MKASTIKWMDRKLGVPLCFLLSFLSKIIPQKSRSPKRVVFIKLIEQGASVLAYSALKYSVEKYGKENVYFLVFSENRFILDQLNVLDPKNVIEVRNDGLISFCLSTLKAISRLRSLKVDSSVDLEFFSRASVIFSYLMGATNRVGLHRFQAEQPYRGSLITHRLIYNPYLHVSKYYLLMCKALEEKGGSEPILKIPSSTLKVAHPQLKVPENEIEAIERKFELSKDRKMIILNPNAGDMLPLRKWEESKFGELAQQLLSDQPDLQIVFTGIEKERKSIEKLIQDFQLSKAINLAGRTSFPELMALYEISDLLITNDSGPAHFASLYDTRIVVLFGPESPYLYAPLSERVEVIYKNLACSPCVNVYNHRFSPCTNNICMQSIEVGEVLEKAKIQLKFKKQLENERD